MSGKHSTGRSQAIGLASDLAVEFGTRKLVTLGWKRVTGKEPPGGEDDAKVGIAEALIWAAVLGVTMELSRIMLQRLATRSRRRDGADDS
jgi:hypothetical protein